jgi:hypothetical protein
MALSSPFYFALLRKYVTMFGYIFDDIRIERYTVPGDTGSETELIKVPITYGPKDKMLARVIEDPTIQRQDAIQLPLISFEMSEFQYDSSRKLPSVNRNTYVNTSNPNQLYNQYVPVPYNIGFTLYVYVKNTEDGNKIIEQILPFFTPDWTLTAELIPQMNYTVDIPIILNSVQMDDAYDGNFEKRRALIWTLNFTLKGYMFGPVGSSNIIKFAETNIYSSTTSNILDSVGNSTPSSTITVQPGYTANGQPTTNANTSIPYTQILSTDNYGYIVTITDAG